MSRASRIPAGRLERLARVGWLAGEVAVGGAIEGLRRVGRAGDEAGSVFFTAGNAERLVRRLSRLRGAAMKAGQMLSLEAGDLLPPEVSERLAQLRADGDPMRPEQLRAVLSDAWGEDWPKRIARFDLEPMAAASIGQVHAAVALDGSPLAIKVQFPGIARSIDSDVDNLASAFRLARILPAGIDVAPVVEETKRQLRREADYRREAASLARYAGLLADEPELVVPRVVEELTTRRVLAMQRLEGLPLEDLCGPDHSPERRDRAGSLLIRLMLRELFEFRFMQTDPNFANYLWLPDGRIGLLDLGAGQAIPRPLARAYAVLFRAVLDGDRSALEGGAREIGFFDDADPVTAREAMLDLILLASEPFRAGGRYDFGSSDLPGRAREASLALVLSGRVRRAPPAATLFLQRKLGGTFLLCHRLGSRVAARELLEKALAPWG
jgi:predicted unusual protein kinase regulating ubiquinone biosynthesis (AarF/ABC1/UbiB family)